jgi:putative restriction endonuclease
MSHCVFMHRADSIYEDSPSEQYQFPKQYLSRADGSVGDWIVYLEPSKVPGTRGYFAVARVQEIIPDPKAAGMYLALIEPGSYLDFASPVRFNEEGGLIERGLLNEFGRLSGRAQAAVRPISSADFLRIVERGLDDADTVLPRDERFEADEAQTPYFVGEERERLQFLTNRAVRDKAFRRTVLRAYDERCAITGLKFINGGGRAEVNATHIQPVERNGPDIIGNGIALSGTIHWMFDRGLIGLSDDLEILISRKVNNIDSVYALINKDRRAWPPQRAPDRPHPHFLQWHRENRFET